jgi:hypothetical protein
MLKVPKRLPYEAALLAALLLGSCDSDKPDAAGLTMAQRDEVRDLAREATTEDRGRIAAIEQKLNMDEGDDS